MSARVQVHVLNEHASVVRPRQLDALKITIYNDLVVMIRVIGGR
jgi:hypothetical protein